MVRDDGFKTSLSEFTDDKDGAPKKMGEGAAGADYEWGWDGPEPENEASFSAIWDTRRTSPQTTTTGSLEPPGYSAGSGGDFTGSTGGLVKEAMRYIGTPYKWGGNTPLGFDCSGFTRYVFKKMGINLPRISYQQGTGGRGVGRKEIRPGDLVFWDNSPRNHGADHVGIYIGNGKYIHAPQPGERVKISRLSGNYWVRRYT